MGSAKLKNQVRRFIEQKIKNGHGESRESGPLRCSMDTVNGAKPHRKSQKTDAGIFPAWTRQNPPMPRRESHSCLERLKERTTPSNAHH